MGVGQLLPDDGERFQVRQGRCAGGRLPDLVVLGIVCKSVQLLDGGSKIQTKEEGGHALSSRTIPETTLMVARWFIFRRRVVAHTRHHPNWTEFSRC